MISSGYSGTPLAQKLGIKPGHRVGTFNPPPQLVALLEPLPEGVVLVRSPRKTCPVSLAFGTSTDELAGYYERAVRVLPPQGGLWLAWPKQASGVETEVTFSGAQSIGLEGGLVDNKVCSIDETWSGLRFVVRVNDRPGWFSPV